MRSALRCIQVVTIQ